MNSTISRRQFALKLAATHLFINLVLAAVVAALVFGLWYREPYAQMLGGLQLLGLVVAVDVVCGPVLTSVLANPKKSRRELGIDLSLVGLVQLAALLYGLHTVVLARPVFVAFDVDRFVTVSAADIDANQLNMANPKWQSLPLTGVQRIGLRAPKDDAEKLQSIELSVRGVPPIVRPNWWIDVPADEQQKVLSAMRPVAQLQQKYPNHADLNRAIAESGVPAQELYFLPFTSVQVLDWTVLLDKNGEFKAFVKLDAFFK